MKTLPRTLAKIIADRPDQFDEGWSELDGFNPSGGYAHWIYLKRGWCNGDQGSHIIHECTVKECLAVIRSIERCTCDDCIDGKFWGVKS